MAQRILVFEADEGRVELPPQAEVERDVRPELPFVVDERECRLVLSPRIEHPQVAPHLIGPIEEVRG